MLAAAVMSIVLIGWAADSIAATAADLPPAGRSLFDHLTTREADGRQVQHVPYPFAALLTQIERHAGSDILGRPGMAAVLIPLGRSLQRNASPGHYFEHPRVVVAVTGESRRPGSGQPMLLKDRLFLGFQDEAGVIEVISYNEAAGRFEFQIVTGYRPGGSPQVFYARRTLCIACHQGAGPIFSRPSWDETNANPAVARALAVHASAFHGVNVARGVDVPNAIDDSVARANRIALAQTLWRDACAQAGPASDPVACRQAALLAALEWRLGGMRSDRGAHAFATALQPLLRAWKARWPHGLPEPDPNIANRDPFFGRAQELAQNDPAATPWGADEITPAIDPIVARPPIDRWHADARGAERFVRSLAELIAQTDIERLSQRLDQGAAKHEDSGIALERAVAAMAADTRAGRSDVLAALPFRRAATMRALFRQLGVAAAPVCCDQDASAWMAARLESSGRAPAAAVPGSLLPFYRHCATCHDLPSASPPGFLHGSIDQVEHSLRRCAPRIRFRLAMWQLGSAARPKVPMPPPVAAPAWERSPPKDDLDRMLRYVDDAGAAATGDPTARAYESLPACRDPAATAAGTR